MWILDSEGDFLEGKRVWLRPGKKYLFGRIGTNGVRHGIDHNSISRKHLVIEVSPVSPGDGSNLSTRSQLIVSDQGSKCGTMIDGEAVKGQSVVLADDEHFLKLGRYKHLLRIKWHPTVLTFSFSSRELKAPDPLQHVRPRLEGLDIKTIIPYVVGHTTHVVQNKRNTAKGLQALVNGQYIVQDSYIDALEYAATPSDLENVEALSPLEADFDSAWPDATEHLPPPGREVVQRPSEAFAPRSDRNNVFDGYTFVFCDATQCENLQDPITNGHGKALLYTVERGVTTPDDIIQFMKNAGGDKGFGSQRDSPGGVVLVRFRAKGEWEDWSVELGNLVAREIDQRVIEQSEFLDAILSNDAAPLRRGLPAPPASSPPAAESQEPPPPSLPASDAPVADTQMSEPQPSEPPSPPKTKKKPRARQFISKMKTFDDGFDINSVPAHMPQDDDPESLPLEPESAPQPSQPIDRPEDEEEDVVSSLLPGAAAMKRRRAASTQRTPNATPHTPPEETEHKPKRQKLEVLEAARQHREAEEEAARRQAEEASLGDVDVDQLKGLAIVEDMDVPVRKPARDDSAPDARGARWDDRWNGRKNFKKFRRKGDGGPARRIQTLMVPLEEVTRQEFGIGEHYWRRSGASEGRSGERTRASSSSARVVSQDVSEDGDADVDGNEKEKENESIGARSRTPARTGSSARGRNKRVREESESGDSEEEPRFRFRRKR